MHGFCAAVADTHNQEDHCRNGRDQLQYELCFPGLSGPVRFRFRPDAGFFFLVGSMSMIGIPLFAGFASKLQFALAGVESGSHVKLVAVMLALAASSLLNAVYFMRTLIRIYSDPRGTVSKANIRQHHRPLYNIPMVVLGGLNLFLGLFSWVAINLITQGLKMFG